MGASVALSWASRLRSLSFSSVQDSGSAAMRWPISSARSCQMRRTSISPVSFSR